MKEKLKNFHPLFIQILLEVSYAIVGLIENNLDIKKSIRIFMREPKMIKAHK